MSIKNVKPNKRSGYKQGYFDVSESTKYIGPQPVIWRSSWEKRFILYCESNPAIISWSSEPFEVRYFSTLDRKFHKYTPDFYVKVQKGDVIEECVIEIKPKDQLRKPTIPQRKTKKTIAGYKAAVRRFITNMCKIDALKVFAKSRGYKIMLLTEDNLVI